MSVKSLGAGAYGNWVDALANANRKWDDGAVEPPATGWIAWTKLLAQDAIGKEPSPQLTNAPHASAETVAARVRANLIHGLANLVAPEFSPNVSFNTEEGAAIRRVVERAAEDLKQAGVPLQGDSALEGLILMRIAQLEREVEKIGSKAEAAIAPLVSLITKMDVATVRDTEAFALNKLAELVGNARRTGSDTISLSSIREGVHHATMGIDSSVLSRQFGIKLAHEDAIVPARKIFFRTLAPLAEPSGKVVILPPGYSESSANMLEQAEELRKKGHWVVCPDMKFDGFGETTSGKFNSLVHVARDIAEIALSEGERIRKEELAGHPQAEVILSGNSTTGGASILAAQLLRCSAIRDGTNPPARDYRVAVASPYTAPSEGFRARMMNALAHAKPLSILTNLPLLAGSPLLPMHHDPVTNSEMMQVELTEGHRSAIRAFADFDSGLALMRALAAKGVFPSALTAHIDAKDPVASVKELQSFIEASKRAGNFAHLTITAAEGDHSGVQDDKDVRYLPQIIGALPKVAA